MVKFIRENKMRLAGSCHHDSAAWYNPVSDNGIVGVGPDPRYVEPGGQAWNDGFSMYLEVGSVPFWLCGILRERKVNWVSE